MNAFLSFKIWKNLIFFERLILAFNFKICIMYDNQLTHDEKENTMNQSFKWIGQTPVYQLENSRIYAKLEKYNLSGSVKDRAVLGMYEEAVRQNKIKEDTVFVEASSGNTGISLAMLGAVLQIPTVILMPESMSLERRQIIKAFGAQLILTPKEEGMKGSLARAEALLAKYPNALSLSQFDNQANPKKHYETTALEILEQVPQVDVFVAGVGTGGTFTGVSHYLKQSKPNLYCVALEPADSPAISEGKAGPHKIQGIGAGFIPQNFDKTYMDEVLTITNEEAIEEAKAFMRTTGMGIGISSGAALVGAKKMAEKFPDKNIVTILPDGVDKYLSVLDFEEVNHLTLD